MLVLSLSLSVSPLLVLLFIFKGYHGRFSLFLSFFPLLT